MNGAYCKMECALVLIVWQEHHDSCEIHTGPAIWRMTFSANGEYLVSSHSQEVRVWRVEDGKEMARLEAKSVCCLAVSKDGHWIAGGIFWGDVIVWDANTYKQKCWWKTAERVEGLDFSPDATRLISTSYYEATIWDLVTGNEVRKLVHEQLICTGKYSPEGDRIATVTWDHVRVWDSEDGRLLHKIKVTECHQVGLVWGSSNDLIVVSMRKVWKIKGTTISEWSIPEISDNIAVQSRGDFLASTTSRTVRFWAISTQIQLPLIQHSQHIQSITLSPDGQFIAIAGMDQNVTIKRLSHISVSIVPSCISTSLLCSCFCLRVAFYLCH